MARFSFVGYLSRVSTAPRRTGFLSLSFSYASGATAGTDMLDSGVDFFLLLFSHLKVIGKSGLMVNYLDADPYLFFRLFFHTIIYCTTVLLYCVQYILYYTHRSSYSSIHTTLSTSYHTI